MASSFSERKPWAATLIGLVFGPIIGMLYLNRAKYASRYLAVLIVFAPLPFVLAHFQIMNIDPRVAVNHLVSLFQVFGALHCFSVARKRQVGTLKWYSRWYSLVFLFLGPRLI